MTSCKQQFAELSILSRLAAHYLTAIIKPFAKHSDIYCANSSSSSLTRPIPSLSLLLPLLCILRITGSPPHSQPSLSLLPSEPATMVSSVVLDDPHWALDSLFPPVIRHASLRSPSAPNCCEPPLSERALELPRGSRAALHEVSTVNTGSYYVTTLSTR
jgi:hypothetical protein